MSNLLVEDPCVDLSTHINCTREDGHPKEEIIMSTRFNKGTALITGASTGIGVVYADRLAKRARHGRGPRPRWRPGRRRIPR